LIAGEPEKGKVLKEDADTIIGFQSIGTWAAWNFRKVPEKKK
jgi:hypothetical protein